MLGKINLNASMRINGIVEEYKVASGGSVNAGDFVKFVTAEITNGISTQLANTSDISNYMKAIKLSETKVFMCYFGASYIYGAIITINANTITIGTSTQLDNYAPYSYKVDILSIDDTRVLLTCQHSRDNDNPIYLYSRICTIDDNTIMVGTPIKLGTSLNLRLNSDVEFTNPQAILLNADKVIINYGYDYYDGEEHEYHLVSTICTINTNVITIINETYINKGIDFNTIKLATNKLLTYVDTNYILHTITNNTITTTTLIKNNPPNLYISQRYHKLIKYNEEIVVLVYYDTLTYLYASVGKIENNSITFTSTLQLVNTENASPYKSLDVTNVKNNIMVYFGDKDRQISSIYIRLVGLTLLLENTYKLNTTTNSGQNISICNLTNTEILAFHSGQSIDYLNYVTTDVDDYIKSLETKSDIIVGVAKTSGTSGNNIKLYIPNV